MNNDKSKFDELTSMENYKKYFLLNKIWWTHNSMNTDITIWLSAILSESLEWKEQHSWVWWISTIFMKPNLTNVKFDESDVTFWLLAIFCLKVLNERKSMLNLSSSLIKVGRDTTEPPIITLIYAINLFPWCQSYKTYYGRNLRFFVIS